MRKPIAMACVAIAALTIAMGSDADARRHARCARGQIYRVSLGVCEGRRHSLREERRATRQAARQATREAAREARQAAREARKARRNPKLTYVRVVEPEEALKVERPASPCGDEAVPLALLPIYDLPHSTVLHPPKPGVFGSL